MKNKKIWSFLLSVMLIVAMALCMVGCDNSKNDENGAMVEATEDVDTTQILEDVADEVTVLGEGTTVFTFTVVDGEGNETIFEIHTDKEYVGEALLELNLIEGEEGAYGLYVKTVNGITADYDADGVYWSFYVNGEYAMSGVDTTPITEGEAYMFKVEKA